MAIYLIRHTAPAIAEGICYGQSDIDVQDALCASDLAKLLADIPAPFVVYSSPLQRCAKLALQIQAQVIFDERLMEMNFGSWEMQSWDAIERDEIDAWANNLITYAPGGSESVTQFAQRTLDFLQELCAKKATDQRTPIIVTHAGWMRLALHYAPDTNAQHMANMASRKSTQIGFGACVKLAF